MEHATALVIRDATTPFICGCAGLVAAGWKVNCAACGRIQFDLGDLPSSQLVLNTALYTDAVEVDDDPVYGEHGELVADIEDRAYDEQRDAELVDEAERRVA